MRASGDLDRAHVGFPATKTGGHQCPDNVYLSRHQFEDTIIERRYVCCSEAWPAKDIVPREYLEWRGQAVQTFDETQNGFELEDTELYLQRGIVSGPNQDHPRPLGHTLFNSSIDTFRQRSRISPVGCFRRVLAIRLHYFIFFAFNLIVSPLTKMPFPLYGSGFLHSRISAANWLTTCLSHPSNSILVGCGVLAVTPSGTPSSIGCEYPTLSETNFWPGYSGDFVMAVFSIVALYPTPTSRRIAVWPSLTPRM